MEMFLRRLATIHNTGLAASIGAPASPKTQNDTLFGPSFGRNGPIWEVWGFEIAMQEPNVETFSWFGPPFSG